MVPAHDSEVKKSSQRSKTTMTNIYKQRLKHYFKKIIDEDSNSIDDVRMVLKDAARVIKLNLMMPWYC